MKCKKCGKEIKKTDVFCQYCGTKVEAETEEKKVETKKTTTKKAEKVEAVKVEPVEEKKSGNGLAIAGMVLGIIGIVLSFAFGPFAFLFPLLGLILSLCAKKCGFKTAGIITSIVGFVIEIVITILAVTLFSSLMAIFGSYIDDYDDYVDNYNYSYKYASVYGEWTCTPYPESDYKTKEETTLDFKYSGKFIYGPKGDLDDNHYSGTFTYKKEYDKNAKYTDREFIMVTPTVTEAVLDGVKQTTSDKSLNIEMEFINDYKEAIIIFENTYNTYHCKKQ